LLSRRGKASSVFTPETLSKILQPTGPGSFGHNRPRLMTLAAIKRSVMLKDFLKLAEYKIKR